MSLSEKTVTILHGEDEFAIAEMVGEFLKVFPDPTLAQMNTSRIDGKTLILEDLPAISTAMPFLAARRLVIVSNIIERLESTSVSEQSEKTPKKNKEFREKFLKQLENLPTTTALVWKENRKIAAPKGNKDNKHWLEKWVDEHPNIASIREYPMPKGSALVGWIQIRVRKIVEQLKKDGIVVTAPQISPKAAQFLASLVGEEPRLLEQEIYKLLAYVNYRRNIEIDDVQAVTSDTAERDIFIFVDALGAYNGSLAMSMLQHLLEQNEPPMIFGMIVRQFRLLIQVREQIDASNMLDIAKITKLHEYVVKKLIPQAQHFTIPNLEAIYRRLLVLDEMMKTSKMGAGLALETFVAEVTSPAS